MFSRDYNVYPPTHTHTLVIVLEGWTTHVSGDLRCIHCLCFQGTTIFMLYINVCVSGDYGIYAAYECLRFRRLYAMFTLHARLCFQGLGDYGVDEGGIRTFVFQWTTVLARQVYRH